MNTHTLFLILATGLLVACNPEKKRVALDADSLEIPIGYTKNLKWNLLLDSVGENGSVIKWTSSNTEYIADDGILLKKVPYAGEDVYVTMTATIEYGNIEQKKSFDIKVAKEEPPYDAYLFAYFEGSGDRDTQEQLRYGISADAVNWYALNDNKPIIPSSEISSTGGIRDPHILRGEDEKTFYMVATDMFTIKNGWGANPGIILMKSNDMVNWTHGIIDFATTYPDKFENVQWVWAPQTIYDPDADKYMVYFTVRYKEDDKLDFYYAYANEDFTAFEHEPEFMFRAKYGAIDGDIIYKDGTYHFFYKGNTKDENGKEFTNGIQQAFGKSLHGSWTEDFVYLDVYAGTRTNVEGSSIFKLNNSDTYILMYDLYSNGRYEFQRSTDLYNFTQTPESFTKNFHPRHGSVIGITTEEVLRLNNKWGGVPEEVIEEIKNRK